MTLIALPAFTNNYIWLLHDGIRAVVVDPGQAQPVLAALGPVGAPGSLQLEAILITHHHADHVGGVDELRAATGAHVFGPARENIPEPLTRLHAGQTLQALGLRFEVIEVPGHTAGHLAFYCADVDGAPLLFCGDTLFSGGCGRLFEGTPAQMLDSLTRLAQLPDATLVCCAHEYTLANLEFARAVEPLSRPLINYQSQCESQRLAQRPTLPSNIALERAINPFLRTRQRSVMDAALAFDANTATDDEVSVFATLRQWKNEF